MTRTRRDLKRQASFVSQPCSRSLSLLAFYLSLSCFCPGTNSAEPPVNSLAGELGDMNDKMIYLGSMDEPAPEPPKDKRKNVVMPTTRLSNGLRLPLVGLGVGNMEHDLVHDMVTNSLENNYRLFDTSRSSGNEDVIAQGIVSHGETKGTVHVLTKVWYTHLGHGRTRLSVLESVANLLSKRELAEYDMRIHVLLHWPRCRDDVEWMHCQEEEEELADYVKQAGPSPLTDRKHAWMGSWRALEELYYEGVVSSIGVSNFDLMDMLELLGMCAVTPHIYQGNIWTVLNARPLMSILRERNIHFQAYNVMNGIVVNREKFPAANEMLEAVSEEKKIPVPQLVLSWLVHKEIGVIPRTSSTSHLADNSPIQLSQVERLNWKHSRQVERAAAAIVSGVDIGEDENETQQDGVAATFVNSHSGSVKIFWFDDSSGEEHPVIDSVKPGDTHELLTHPKHVFRAYDEGGKLMSQFHVSAGYGSQQKFVVKEEEL